MRFVRQCTAVLLALAMTFVSLPSGLPSLLSGLTAYAANEIIVGTADDLVKILTGETDVLGKTVKLTANITLSEPFAPQSEEFFRSMTFDGNGYYIQLGNTASAHILPQVSNPQKNTLESTAIGLFPKVDGCTFTNVEIRLAANVCLGYGAETDTYSYTPENTSEQFNAGLLAGEAKSTRFVQCAITVSNPDTKVIWKVPEGFSVSMMAPLVRSYSMAAYMGGLVGCADSYSSFSQCYNEASLEVVQGNVYEKSSDTNAYGGAVYLGGILGYSSGTNISDSKVYRSDYIVNHAYPNFALHSSFGTTYSQVGVGGLVGLGASDTKVTNCLIQDIGVAVRDIKEDTQQGMEFQWVPTDECRYGRVFGVDDRTLSYVVNTYASVSTLDSTYVTVSSDTANSDASLPAYILGTSWVDTVEGVPNLSWLVDSAPESVTVTIDGGDAKLVINPNDQDWYYDAQIPLQGKMATPTNVEASVDPPTPSVTSVSVAPNKTPPKFYEGASYQFQATVAGNNVAADNTPVTWTVYDGSGLERPGLITDGLLTIPDDYTGTLKVRATAGGKTGDRSITVSNGTIQINSKESLTVAQGGYLALSATLTGSTVFTSKGVTWAVTGGAKSSIDKDGILTVGKEETAAGTLTVTATVTGTSISDTATVTVTKQDYTKPAASITLTPTNTWKETVSQQQTLRVESPFTITIAGDSVTVGGKVYTKDGDATYSLETGSAGSGTFSGNVFTPSTVGEATITVTQKYTYTPASEPGIGEGTAGGSTSSEQSDTKTYTATIPVNILEKMPETPTKPGAASNTLINPSVKEGEPVYYATTSEVSSAYVKVYSDTPEVLLYAFGKNPTTFQRYSTEADQSKGVRLTAGQLTQAKKEAGLKIKVKNDANADLTYSESPVRIYVIKIDGTGAISATEEGSSFQAAQSNTVATLTGVKYATGADSVSLQQALVDAGQYTTGSVPDIAAGEVKVSVNGGKEDLGAYPNHRRESNSASAVQGSKTPTPVIRPRVGDVINPQVGVTIESTHGATVYYTLTPDGTDTTDAMPDVNMMDGGRTKIYTVGTKISFPENTSTFTVRAVAKGEGMEVSDMDFVQYTNSNLPAPEVPQLLITESQSVFSPNTVYDDGTVFYFQHDQLGTDGSAESGQVYYTVNGSTPNPPSYGIRYDVNNPPKLFAGTNETVQIKAVFYNPTTSQVSAVVTYDVQIKQNLDGPAVANDGPASGSMVRPNQELELTLSDTTLEQVSTLYEAQRVIYKEGSDQGVTLDPNSDTPIEGAEYISVVVQAGTTVVLPEIYYTLDDSLENIREDGIRYQYAVRVVTATPSGSSYTYQVRYTNAAKILLGSTAGSVTRVRTLTATTGASYGNSGVVTYTYTVRGAASPPSVFPTTDANNPTQLEVGSQVALVPETPNTLSFYTLNGTKPAVTMSNENGQITWTPANSYTYLYEDANPIVVQNDSQLVLTVNAIAVSTDDSLETSAVATYRFAINKLEQAAVPTSLPVTDSAQFTQLKNGEQISLSTTTLNSYIYYTTDGSLPDADARDDWDEKAADTANYTTGEDGNGRYYMPVGGGEKVYEPVTQIYDNQTGIVMAATNVKPLFTIIAVVREQSDPARYADSTPVSFSYRLKTADLPVADPVTSLESPATLMNGERISLNTQSGDVDIYYTLDSTTPRPEDYKAWLENKGTVGADGKLTYTDASGQVVTVSTYLYDDSQGISMQLANGSSLLNIYAVSADDNYVSSSVARFTYQLARAAAPQATPATSSDDITTVSPLSIINLSTTTADCDIYYTTDNTKPVPGSGTTKLYNASEGIVMPEGTTTFFTIRAISRSKSGSYGDSDESFFTYQPPAPVQAVFASPYASDKVVYGQEVTLQCSTKDAEIFYHIYTSRPDDEDVPVPYEDEVFDPAKPIVITEHVWIKAMAVRDGVKSVVTTYEYDVAPELKAPTSSLGSGSIVAKGVKIKLSASSSATVWYTKDGSDPKDPENKAVFSGTQVVLDADYGETMVINAYASRDGYTPSEVSSFSYTICEEEEYLKATPETNSVVEEGTVLSLITSLSGAEIYYTLDGSTPTTDSLSGGNITLTGEPGATITVKAAAIADGVDGIFTKVFTYTLQSRTAAPTASIPDGAIIMEGATVTLTAKSGDIFFTTDGTDPTTSSRLYVEPIAITGSMVLKAIAVEEDKAPSTIVQYVYTYAGQTAAPVMSVPGGEIQQYTQVELTSQTEGATIYYTTDGMDPTTDSILYSGPITITRPVTLRAIAVKTGLHDSVVNSATYTVREVEEPEETGQETEIPKVTMTDRLTSRRDYSGETQGPTYTDVVVSDTENNAVLSAPSSSLPSTVSFIVTPMEISDQDQTAVDEELGYDIVDLYDVIIEDLGVPIQPTGPVEIGIPIPAQYQNGVVVVCRINDDGSVESFPTRRSDGIAYVEVNHFSKYAVTVPVADYSQQNLLLLILLCVTGSVVSCGLVFAVIYLVRKRKKTA